MKTKKIVQIALLIAIFLVYFTACGSRPLNKKKIAQIIPQQILTVYNPKSGTRTFTVRDVKIENRRTTKTEDIVNVIIKMDDTLVSRTARYTLTLRKYQQGWQLESYERDPRQDTNSPLHPPTEEMAFEAMKAQEFTNFSLTSKDIYLNSADFSFQINEERPVLSVSGDMKINLTWDHSTLSYVPNVESASLTPKLDIIGNWSGEYVIVDPYTNIRSTRRISLNVTNVTASHINATFYNREGGLPISINAEIRYVNSFRNQIRIIIVRNRYDGEVNWEAMFTPDKVIIIDSTDRPSRSIQLNRR